MRISDIQRFCMHDGPGVRTTVFLKGCPLRCEWCHNPETQRGSRELLFYQSKCIGCGICSSCENGVHDLSECHILRRELCAACGKCAGDCPTGAIEISGRDMTAKEVFSEIVKDVPFYGDRGGVTLSGGEPLLQWEECAELLCLCREHGIHTAIETCGYFAPSILEDMVPLCDLFLWDVKDTDNERHIRYTGKDNAGILENLRLAGSIGAKTRLRCILVAGVNTNDEHYTALAELAHSLRGCEGVELMPYHTYGESKREALGGTPSAHPEWIPEKEQIEYAVEYMTLRGIRGF